MIKKEIDKLPENMLIEVYDLVRFLETKKDKELITKTSQEMPETLFEKIRYNEEDSAYDKL